MRNNNFSFLFLPFVMVFLLLFGCKKEDKQINQSVKPATENDYKIYRTIESFKKKVNSQLKDAEEISIDSAVWYIEASLNETYARTESVEDRVWSDSAFAEIPLTDNQMILLSDVSTAYNALIQSLSTHYHAVAGDIGLLLVDINLLSTDNEKITIRMRDYFANRPVPPTPNAWTFGPSDHWYWGLGLGKCTASGYQGLDAATQLTTYANNSLQFGGSTQYFTNLSNTGWIMPESVPASSPNPFGYYSYMLYENGSPNLPAINNCLEPSAMNYYLDNLKQIALLPQYKPSAKSVANYLVTWDLVVPNYGWIHIHRALITYGVQSVAIDPPDDL